MASLKQTQCRGLYTELKIQEYINTISPKFARYIFHIRTGTVDLRGVRSYMYGEDTLCRLCGEEDETVEHVVNNCKMLGRKCVIDINSTECDVLKEVALQYAKFKEMVDSNSGSVE